MDNPTKRCGRCGEAKPRDAFWPSARDGLQAQCKECRAALLAVYRVVSREKVTVAGAAYRVANRDKVKAREAAYRAANREKVKAARDAWTAANPGKKKASTAAWSAANPERVKAGKVAYVAANRERVKAGKAAYRAVNREKVKVYEAAYRIANRERRKAANAAWQRNNPTIVAANYHKRRARKIAAEGSFTRADIETIRRLQRDRCAICRRALAGRGTIDHIVALAAGGSNGRRNLQLVCRPCNSSKHVRDAIDFMQSRGFLL